MKIGIMSDCHLGERRFRKQEGYENAFKMNNYRVFKEALNILKDTDCILIAGDFFDSPNPNVDSIIVGREVFKTNKPTYIIGGNHDFSRLSDYNGYHCFDILRDDNSEVKFISTIGIFDLDESTRLFCISYGQLTPENFELIENNRVKDKRNILMIHGYLDINNNKDVYSLPKVVAKNYDFIVCGHIHLPGLIGNERNKILTPGSLMPSTAAFSSADGRPSVWIYDSELNDVERIILSSAPEVYNLYTDDINKTLNDIAIMDIKVPPICNISYSGSMADIDEVIYKRALQKSLNLSISTIEKSILKEPEDESLSSFWDFIEDNYPEYYNEFKEIIKEG